MLRGLNVQQFKLGGRGLLICELTEEMIQVEADHASL
jgi:hypothetical protein